MAISMAELAKQLLTAKQPERYAEVMDRGPYSTGEPLNIGYGADDQMSPLDAAALITSPVPVVGDVTGLAADVDMYMRDPESRNIPNYILSAAGVVPFVPAASQIRKGIKAYHGSPHSFDRFSTESIGTGEGAQAYGRGLYFAENEKVAKEYRDQLTPRDLDYEDWLMGKYKDAESNQDYARMEMYERAMLNETPQDFKDLAADVDYDEDYRGLAAEVGEEIEEYGPDLGSMYEVNIDVEPDELLDWYKPLAEQPELLKKLDDTYGDHDIVLQQLGLDLRYENPTGMDLADALNMRRGTDTSAPKLLEDAGIKGVRYADAFTRHKSPDKQSMNYVIFDDRLITIAKKYGVAIPVAAAMLARATGEDTSQSFQEET
jgi:hypothetical protein